MYIPTSKWIIEYQPIATQKLTQSLQNSKKQFASRQKRSLALKPTSYMGYISILIHLLNRECLFLLKGVILNLVELDF